MNSASDAMPGTSHSGDLSRRSQAQKAKQAAPVTPLANGGQQLDERAFFGLVERQVEEGTERQVVAGLTGVAPTLTVGEHDRLLRVAVEAAAGRVPVIARSGTDCTRSSIEPKRPARAAGAAAELIVTPYYTKLIH